MVREAASLFSLPYRLILALLCLALSCACASTAGSGAGPTATAPAAQAKAAASEDEIDRALERRAREALGDREGTIVLMDAQNGRLRAVINPRIAFEQAFPPGSAIKPFTALAALRAGLIDAETHKSCPALYAREGFSIACTHPRTSAPIDLAHALAYSCNYYFASVGERLSAGAFDATLASFGFGERTGVNALNESAGSLRNGSLGPGDVLGEGEHLLVTPVQLARAYAALINGGHLYRPQLSAASDFKPQQQARLNVSDAHREILTRGMRGALRYGTAASAGLDRLPLQIYGKTGTSTSSNGFRTQGWFVAVADDASAGREAATTPETARLIVLVFLKRAHGAEGAELARLIFEEYLSARQGNAPESVAAETRREEESAHETGTQAARIRVKVTSPSALDAAVESTMQSVTIEEYVRGVLAAESSIETEPEALKAQAVISRTFALKNMGRHASEGFDFCSTTHCQRFAITEDARAAGANGAAIERAVRETAGETLRDARGELIDAYFHAACGGMTANISSLWGGGEAPSYLRGVRDDYCVTMPHHHWTETISAERLLKALRSDPRTDVGARLTDVVVSRTDATGRAETVTLEGERRRTVRGWDFKLIVGRSLGWNVLKSSRFTVARDGSSLVFRGGGFGHGLGLCQEGAHVMARRGLNYRQIVEKYFPGTTVGSNSARQKTVSRAAAPASVPFADDWAHSARTTARLVSYSLPGTSVDAAPLLAGQYGRLWLASEHFRVIYPSSLARREVVEVLGLLEAARRDIERRLTIAGLPLLGAGSLDIVVHATTPDFIAATGQAGWAAAASRGSRIELQPLALLRRRGVLATTLRHEYAHSVIDALGGGRTPRWLAEGLAVHLAGEGAMLARFNTASKWTRDELEQKLARQASSAEEMRGLYAAAYAEVRALIRAEGEPSVWRRVMQNS